MLCTMSVGFVPWGLKINGRIIDTMIATSLIDENRGRYDLNSICKDYIHESKNEYALQDAAKSWGYRS